MRFLIVARIDESSALACAKAIYRLLADSGHQVVCDEETAAGTGLSGATIQDADAQVAVVVGGDGTILLAVQRMKVQIPVLAINWGEVGFLAGLEPAEAVPFLKRMKEGFPVEERMRISLSQDGVYVGDALNEALIVTARPTKMLRFVVSIDGVQAEQFRADGLLISTPTGSTAYAMSAGGPIVDPRLTGVLLVPLAPYLLSARPQLIGADRTIEVRLTGGKPATMVIDGQTSVEIEGSGIIGVKVSPEPARFVDTGKNFFSRVNEKLRSL
jgi:NAD+ kinase